METSGDKYVEAARNIVLQHLDLQRYRVFLFGSRARGTARRGSDIDIGIWGASPVSEATLRAIRQALEDSIVPYNVDLVDFSLVADDLKQEALKATVEWNRPSN